MLKLENVTYKVMDDEREKIIIDNISFETDERFVTITGPNGSGKSTLAKLIAGIIKPTEGRIFYDGTDITESDITQRARMGISYGFQQPVRFKGITVKDLLSIASGEKLSTDGACRFLSEVGMCAKDYIDREVNSSLSGGELKRIEIATILARQTKLSIFDEPEAGIDLWSFNSLIHVFEQMHQKTNGTILIISHQERILDISDRIILLSAGKILMSGNKELVMPYIFQPSGCGCAIGGGKAVQ